MPRDINSKMDRLNIINREPVPSEGAEGDLTVRNTRNGLKLYVKYKNVWEGVGLSQRPFHVDRVGNVHIIKDLTTAADVAIEGDLTVNGSQLMFTPAASTIQVIASEHDAAGDTLTISAGDTTPGTTNNIVGGNLTLQGGKGKGTGVGGSIIFQVADAGSSGSTLNPLATAMTIDEDKAVQFDGSVFVKNGINNIKELASSPTHTASYGTLWVKNDVPNNLYFEDDGGQDFLLNNSPGTILANTHLHPNLQTTQAADSGGAILPIHDDCKVQFQTPQSESVKIDFSGLLDEGTAGATTVLALSTTDRSAGYTGLDTAALSDRFEKQINYGNRGVRLINHTWVLGADYLAAVHSNNELWIAFSGTVDEIFLWGGVGAGRYPGITITATAL